MTRWEAIEENTSVDLWPSKAHILTTLPSLPSPTNVYTRTYTLRTTVIIIINVFKSKILLYSLPYLPICAKSTNHQHFVKSWQGNHRIDDNKNQRTLISPVANWVHDYKVFLRDYFFCKIKTIFWPKRIGIKFSEYLNRLFKIVVKRSESFLTLRVITRKDFPRQLCQTQICTTDSDTNELGQHNGWGARGGWTGGCSQVCRFFRAWQKTGHMNCARGCPEHLTLRCVWLKQLIYKAPNKSQTLPMLDYLETSPATTRHKCSKPPDPEVWCPKTQEQNSGAWLLFRCYLFEMGLSRYIAQVGLKCTT